MSIIKHVTLKKIVAHDFRYDPRTNLFLILNSTTGCPLLCLDLYILNIIKMRYKYTDFLCQTLSMYGTEIAKPFVLSVCQICLVARSGAKSSRCYWLQVVHVAARVCKTLTVLQVCICRWSCITWIESTLEISSLI